MWFFKLKCSYMSIPKRYLQYKFYSETVKSTAAISQAQNVEATSFALPAKVEQKLEKVLPDNPDLGIGPTSDMIKSKSLFTNVSTTIPSTVVSDSKSVSFDDIPGPNTLRLIAKFWGTIPTMGTELSISIIQYMLSGGKFFGGILSWGGNTALFKKFFDVYGPVVRLHGPFGSDVVLLNRPEDACAVFKNEGPYPVRCCLDSVEKYRREYRKYHQAGPFLMYGPEWEKLRKAIEPPLHSTMIQQYGQIGNICDEFIQRIVTIRNKQEEMPEDFKSEIYKWCLECLCSVTLNRKLGFLDSCGLSSNSDPGRLLDSLTGATQAIQKCEYETPAWKDLVKNCDTIDSVLNKHIQRAIESLKEKKHKHINLENISLLEVLLLKESFVAEDALTVLLDMFLIGINATTHTVAFLLYHLARNSRCQIKLCQEIKEQGDIITKEKLKNMKYLQACVKESLRLDPPIPILSRLLNNDVVIHHYLIPKGTHILFASHLNSRREEFFEDAPKFRPERWLTNDLGGFGSEYQAFASMPFGHGPKACLAKEMVELEISLLLVKVLKKFRIEYNYGDLQSSNKLLSSPTKPLKFRFISRVDK